MFDKGAKKNALNRFKTIKIKFVIKMNDMKKMNDVIFYKNDTFYSKSELENFNEEKEFTALPINNSISEKIKVNKSNYLQFAKQCYIPLSMIAMNVSGNEFKQIDDNLGFFDIETDENEHFEVGVINDKIYTDVNVFISNLNKFSFIVGYNIFNFDLNVLIKANTGIKFRTCTLGKFIVHSPIRTVPVDLYKILKHNDKILLNGSMSAENVSNYYGFTEEPITLDDKKAKCLQDIRRLKHIWNEANIPLVYNTLQYLTNTDPMIWQNEWGNQFRKLIVMNEYLKQGYFPIQNPNNHIKAKIIGGVKFLRESKLYKNIKYWDIESAYPTSASMLDFSFYEGENVFPNLMKKLNFHAKLDHLKPYMKNIANRLIGDQADERNWFRNPFLRVKTIEQVNEVCNDFISDDKTVMVNTDCAMYKGDLKYETNKFNIRLKNEFEWIYFWLMDKWIGKDINNKIIERGFVKLFKNPIIKSKFKALIHDTLIQTIEPEKELNKIKKLINKVMIHHDIEDYKFVVRKTETYCPQNKLEYMMIWQSLPFGFNELYLENSSSFTIDKTKINFNAYKKILEEMADEYTIN